MRYRITVVRRSGTALAARACAGILSATSYPAYPASARGASRSASTTTATVRSGRWWSARLARPGGWSRHRLAHHHARQRVQRGLVRHGQLLYRGRPDPGWRARLRALERRDLEVGQDGQSASPQPVGGSSRACPAPRRTAASRSATTPMAPGPCRTRASESESSPRPGMAPAGACCQPATSPKWTRAGRRGLYRAWSVHGGRNLESAVPAGRALERSALESSARARTRPDRLHAADRGLVLLGSHLHGSGLLSGAAGR